MWKTIDSNVVVRALITRSGLETVEKFSDLAHIDRFLWNWNEQHLGILAQYGWRKYTKATPIVPTLGPTILRRQTVCTMELTNLKVIRPWHTPETLDVQRNRNVGRAFINAVRWINSLFGWIGRTQGQMIGGCWWINDAEETMQSNCWKGKG